MKLPPPVYKPAPLKLASPSAYQPHQTSNPGLQLKRAPDLRMKMLDATPSQQPATRNPILQLKTMANLYRRETRPAPPVFNPRSTALPLQQKSNRNPQITPGSNPVLQPHTAFRTTGALPRQQVAVRAVIQPASTARRSESRTVGQGDYRVLQPGDRIDFGYISNCSVVLAENKEGDKVVYHWPLTAWTPTNIDTMEQALREIGWSYKSSDFSIRVWRQAYRDKPSAFEAEMKVFEEQLQAKFTRKVTYVIYEDKKVPTMDDNGEVTLLG